MATFGGQSGVGTSVETGEIEDGAVTNAKVNASAGIVHTKMESDARARANHTGTQTKSTVSDYPAAASQAEMEAGTETAAREMTPERVKQAIVALGASGPLIEADPAEITVVNTATETTLFSASIPANTLLTGKAIRFKAYFSALSWGGNYSITFRIKYGATTVVSVATPSSNNGTSLKGWLEGFILADGSSSAQKGAMGIFFAVDGKEIAADAAVGYTKLSGHASGSAAEVATGALNLVLTGQWEGANVGNTFTAEFWVVDKIT